jgi:hypothetical protein
MRCAGSHLGSRKAACLPDRSGLNDKAKQTTRRAYGFRGWSGTIEEAGTIEEVK